MKKKESDSVQVEILDSWLAGKKGEEKYDPEDIQFYVDELELEDWQALRELWNERDEKWQKRFIKVLEFVWDDYLVGIDLAKSEQKRWDEGSDEVKDQMEVQYERSGNWDAVPPVFDIRILLRKMRQSKYKSVANEAEEALRRLGEQSYNERKTFMKTIILIVLGIAVLYWLLNLHVWSHPFKRGIYKESTIERIIRIVTGRIDD